MWVVGLLCAYMAFISGVMACIWRVYGGVWRGLCGHGLRYRRVGVACVVGCVCVRCMCTVCIRYSVPCRRGLSVGYGVYVW